MKLAHLILAHSKPEMLERLVKRLHHDDSDIYIQLDKKANIADFQHIANIGNVWFVDNRVKTEWGDYSIIKSTLIGFEYILNTGIDYCHINLLSGQDYPLQPISAIHEFFFANTDKTFMRSLSIADNEWEDGKLRFESYSFGDYSFPGRYQLQGIANRLLPKRKIPGNIRPYGRSQWLTITPECARYAIEYVERNPRMKRFFRMTWAVDEIFFQTILENSPLNDKIVHDNLRYIEASGPARPTIFTMAHADLLVSSGKFFARKFDSAINDEIFDFLDNVIQYS